MLTMTGSVCCVSLFLKYTIVVSLKFMPVLLFKKKNSKPEKNCRCKAMSFFLILEAGEISNHCEFYVYPVSRKKLLDKTYNVRMQHNRETALNSFVASSDFCGPLIIFANSLDTMSVLI